MKFCRICGGEVKSAYFNGCWSQLPHTCTLPKTSPREIAEQRPEAEIRESFCRPTVCRRCGASVYFVEHNGGKVVFDQLGWPWPKHPCFDSESFQSSKFSNLDKSFRIGIVTSMIIASEESNRMTVLLEDNQEVAYLVSPAYPTVRLAGKLIIVRDPSLKIIYPPSLETYIKNRYFVKAGVAKKEYTFKELITLTPQPASLECKHCHKFVFDNEISLDIHIWENHWSRGKWKYNKKWKCEICSTSFLTKEGLEIHRKRSKHTT